MPQVILEIIGEYPEGAGDEPGSAVGELAGAAAGERVAPAIQIPPRRGRRGSARDLLHPLGDGAETVDAGPALAGGLGGEILGDAGGLSDRADGAAERDDRAGAEACTSLGELGG